MTLQNFEKARESMVFSQLAPSGVVSEAVLLAYRETPRENFVPNDLRGICYLDDDIRLPGGRILLEPLVHGLMVEAANIKKTDRVLDVAGVTGYSAAVLARLAGSVVAVDQDAEALKSAERVWTSMGLGTISAFVGAHAAGAPEKAPYDVILLNGAVAEIPGALANQLAEGGRILCVLMPKGAAVGTVAMFTKQASGVLTHSVLGTAVTEYVPGLAPALNFVF